MKPGISIKLDKERTLRYGMKALALVEDKLGKSLMFGVDFEKLKISELVTIIWAGLVHEDKDLTLDNVYELIDEYSDITAVAQKLGEAISLAFNTGEKKS